MTIDSVYRYTRWPGSAYAMDGYSHICSYFQVLMHYFLAHVHPITKEMPYNHQLNLLYIASKCVIFHLRRE